MIPGNLEIAVVGVVRNHPARLRRTLDAVWRATSDFRKTHGFVVESDSTDNTPAALEAVSREIGGLAFRSLGSLREQIPQRTARIAHCRNTYLEELATNPRYRAVDLVMVVDMDGVSKDIDARGIGACLAFNEPWAACTANQLDYYYDIWALRHPQWCPGDAWKEHAALSPLIGRSQADNLCFFARMLHIDRNRPPIEVHSAFGGLAIYRRDALLSARYTGLDGAGEEICEHVTLHAAMRANGHRIFVHPALINARRTAHASRKKWFRTVRRTVWRWLRGER